MTQSFWPLTKTNQLTDLDSVQKIRSLEHRYVLTLSKISGNFEQGFETFVDLNNIHSSLISFVDLLKLSSSHPDAKDINPLLDAYIKEVGDIHEQNSLWLTIYLTLIWQEEICSKKIRRTIKKHNKAEWQTRTEKSFKNFDTLENENPERSRNLHLISELYTQRHTLSHHDYQRLINAIYDELMHTIHKNRQAIKDCFKKALYSFHQPDLVRQDIVDWINGYKKPGPVEISAEREADQRITKDLRLCERNKNIKLTLHYLLRGSVLLLIMGCVHFSKMDATVYFFVNDKTTRLLGLDPASINLKHKKSYFQKFILELNDNVSPQEVFNHIEEFKTQRLYEQPNGLYYFAEYILQKYFLLLTRQDFPKELSVEVIKTAGLMDLNIQNIVSKISAMYERRVIEDSKLRQELLVLRRAFVRHNIFPFTFIVVKKETPYLFLYPEVILQRLTFATYNLDFIGFQSSYYRQFVNFPLKVFVVSGQRYPFKDRAGYFEGEFAVVFADIAARTEWSAWHEFAHIIDHMRFTHGGKPFPENMEINAMLFPAIFAQDAQGYLFERIIPIVRTGVAKDSYVQASKGILNGFLIHDSPSTPSEESLITDRFPEESILKAENLIASKSNDDIKKIALEMYKNPQRYLETAKAGIVQGVISNAEEVIAGNPRAPYQGFILSGFGRSGGNSGIKFIFDNDNADQNFFEGKNIFGIIQQIFLFMIHAPNSQAKGFTLMNLIATVVDFFLILGLLIFIHWVAAPFRKRKFYGPKISGIINDVYKNNPLSDGRGSGEQPGEKELLIRALSSQGNITDELKSRIRGLKNDISQPRQWVFDTLLTLAPFNPKNSAIRSKWHDFMFWFPFLGPSTARNPWIFSRQKSFRQWEQFNEQLIALAKSIRRETNQDTFKTNYIHVLKDFKKPSQTADSSTAKAFHLLNDIEKKVTAHFHEWSRAIDLKNPVAGRRLSWLTQSDGEFDHLAAYTWNDDVKRIDWKATARSANHEPKIKKYKGSVSVQIDFLFDFRLFTQPNKREQIAQDFVAGLHILKHDHELKSIALIMPSGEIRRRVLNLKNTFNRADLFHEIWSAVTQEFAADQTERQALAARDLIFYTDEENSMYRRMTQLTDFDDDQKIKILTSIPVKSMNVYLIGVAETDREDIMNLLPRTLQPFYWR